MDTADTPTSAQLAKRMGRPMKAARKGRRYQIGVIVTGETKTLITQAAKASGRTISREVEHLIERVLTYDATLRAMRTTLEEMEKGSIDAVLVRKGYTPIHPLMDPDGLPRAKPSGGFWTVWAEPGYPGIQRSGFEEWTPAERAAMEPQQTGPAAECTQEELAAMDKELDAQWAAQQGRKK
jgi:hypothetical protein